MKFRRTFKVETVQNMGSDELGDPDWLTWEWIEELAQSGSDNPEDGDCWISEPTKEGDRS